MISLIFWYVARVGESQSRGWLARQKGFTIDCGQINQLGLIEIVGYNRIINIINKNAG